MSISSATMPFPARLKTPLQIDPVLLTIGLTLLLGGIVILASASVSISEGVAGEPFYFVKRQLLAVAIGAGSGFACLCIPMRLWRSLGPLLLLTAFALLIVVLIPGVGHTVNGSTRWLRFGVMNLQVSEPAKLCVLLYVAGYLVRQSEAVQEELAGVVRPALVLILISGLLLKQPDYGAVAVLSGTVLVMLFVAGARLKYFLSFCALAVILLAALVFAEEYRQVRVFGFLRPWSDPFGSSYQLSQSLIAIGRGEWFGVGLGDGVQKLFYLPEAHNDFVFAVFAEEFGLLGSLLIVALFAALVWRVFRIGLRAANAERYFEAYLAVGIGTWFGLQTFVNIGVNLGIMPTKGITLPFISYGRSSLIVTMICIGLLLRIHHELEVDASPANRRKIHKGRKK